VTGALRLPDWAQLTAAVPGIAAPMRRYLQQLAAILRPGSGTNADQALRALAAFLAAVHLPRSLAREQGHAARP
jgi:hypothetical protein